MSPVRRRAAYLKAMGIADWKKRGKPDAAAGEPFTGAAAEPQPEPEREPAVAPTSSRRQAPTAKAPVAPTPGRPLVAASDARADDWHTIAAEVAGCVRCPLHECRTNTVFGVGDRKADWLIVGEAPGAEEDRQGEPFVGRAGQLLNSMLRGMGLAREQVFIANVLKCRPPNNRDPAPAEVAQCLPYLERQVALLQPKIMLAVGRIAAQNLLATDTPIGKLRGQLHAFGTSRTPLVVTYHPAYLLRSPTEKRKAWEDLKFARRVSRERTA